LVVGFVGCSRFARRFLGRGRIARRWLSRRWLTAAGLPAASSPAAGSIAPVSFAAGPLAAGSLAARSLAAVSLAAVSLAAGPQEDEIAVKFRECAAKKDRAALVALWRAHPVRRWFDRRVPRGFARQMEEARAKKQPVDEKEIAAMHATALFGASCADEAFGTAIFSDYASSFVGLDEAQQYKFRRGQAAHKEAQALLREKKGAEALEHAKECAELARPLGDWWGTAMGVAAMGKAYELLDKKDEALSAYSLAA
jgi:hypothetical protein